jgi:hypothetical protein
MHLAHGAVSEAQIRFANRSYSASREFEHFQSCFARRRETRPAAKKYRTPEIRGRNLCQQIKLRTYQFSGYCAHGFRWEA